MNGLENLERRFLKEMGISEYIYLSQQSELPQQSSGLTFYWSNQSKSDS